jgi:hypothetical protein
VTAETQRYLELLEQRIALLGNLAQSISTASNAFVSFDLDTIENRIAEQQRLCRDLGALSGQIDRVQKQCTTHLTLSVEQIPFATPDPAAVRLRETLDRLGKAQATVKQLNDAHQVLLRRSRRTVGALLNSYHSFAITYANPAAPRAAAGERL